MIIIIYQARALIVVAFSSAACTQLWALVAYDVKKMLYRRYSLSLSVIGVLSAKLVILLCVCEDPSAQVAFI